MTRVILHIGTEKTGTTSIQHFMQANRRQLREKGIIYPHIGSRDDAHYDLVNELHPLDNQGRHLEFLPQPNQPFNTLWQHLKQRLIQESDKVFLLSAEHFSSRLRSNALSFMADFFQQLNITPEILVFLRPQDEFIESSYSTEIKAGSIRTFGEALSHYPNQTLRYNYWQLLTLWANYFGKHAIKVVPYQQQTIGTDVRRYLLNYLGVEQHSAFEFESSERLNEKWSKDMLEFARLFNQHCHFTGTPQQREKWLEAVSLKLYRQNEPGLLTQEQRMAIKHHFAESNCQVAQHYLSKSTLFDETEPQKTAVSDEVHVSAELLPKHRLIQMMIEQHLAMCSGHQHSSHIQAADSGE